MAVTAQNLIDRARQRADFVNSSFLTDSTELLLWTVASYSELWDLLIEAFGAAYLCTTTTLAVSANAETTSISSVTSGMHKLVRMDYDDGGRRVPMRPFSLSDETLSSSAASWTDSAVRYHLEGTVIRWQPIPSAAVNVRLYYIPRPALAALATNIAAEAEPWDEYVVIDLAIKMREKEESDVSTLMLEKQAMRARIMQAASDRDIGQPVRVVDVRRFDTYEWGDWEDGIP